MGTHSLGVANLREEGGFKLSFLSESSDTYLVCTRSKMYSGQLGASFVVVVLLLLLLLLFVPFSPIQSKISTFPSAAFSPIHHRHPRPPRPRSLVIECHYDDDSFGILRSSQRLSVGRSGQGSQATFLLTLCLPLILQFPLPLVKLYCSLGDFHI